MDNSALDHDNIRKLIFQLLHVRHRPGMYLGNYDLERLECLLLGFHIASKALGIDTGIAADSIYETVVADYGWNINYPEELLREHMQRKGVDNRIILNTLIDVEIEVLRRRYDLGQLREGNDS